MTLTPIIKSDDPYFNHEAAELAAEMVMKMDDDEAFMFTHLLMGDVLDQDIEKNRRTLQRHLNDVVAKRIDRIKKAMLTTVSKGVSEEVIGYAEALDEIEKAWRNPYTTGAYQFEESDFRRDTRTGQFQTKVHTKAMRPLKDKQAQNLGIPTGGKKYQEMSDVKRAQYQQEYMQIANFLNAVNESGSLGDHDVQLKIKDRQGNQFYRTLNGKPRLGADWDPDEGDQVVGVHARPTGLTLGGASFALTNSLGHQMSGRSVGTINRADTQFGDFSEDWTKPMGTKNSNDRLYNRVQTGSKFVADVAPDDSKLQVAARFGRAVGEHGAEAEKILGPQARKLTYRYRGTEKTPDEEAVRQFEIVSGRASRPEALTADDQKKLRSGQERAVTRYRKEKAARQGIPEDAITLGRDEIRQVRSGYERRFMEGRERKVSPEASGAGREYLARYLMHRDRAPKKDLYNLQLESGNTPASTGFIVDKDGKIVTQAQGYGDDHYVPFNLRNLKSLKGGEYIRTRSVGGPTSEDIYTGLVSGARRVTVVSRSGYFTVEFDPETTRNGRFNDKARRMVRRYESILDAVQSEQVDRPQKVSPDVREYLTKQVEREVPSASPRQRRMYTAKLIEDYKNELQMTAGDQDEFNAYLEEWGTDLPEDERNALRARMLNDWQAHNEFKFRLNGLGYQDALASLEEQFPYYIHATSGPLKEMGRIETEKDKGYVEPGRNRPTQARAGMFGTADTPGVKGGNAPLQAKFSASQADYQGYQGRGAERAAAAAAAVPPTPPKPPEEGAAAEVPGAPPKPPTGLEAARADASRAAKERGRRAELGDVQEAGVKLARALQTGLEWGDPAATPAISSEQGLRRAAQVFPPLGMERDEDIRAYFGDPMKVRKADEALRTLKLQEGSLPQGLADAMKNYAQASGRLSRVDYDPKLRFNLTDHPYRFPEAAYQVGADPVVAEAEAKKIDQRTRPVSAADQTLSEMDDEDLATELNVLMRLHMAMDEIKQIPETDLPERQKAISELKVDTSIPGVMDILEGDKLERHADDVQRMRALNEIRERGVLEATQYMLPPSLARTQHLEEPTEEKRLANKETARSTAQMLEQAAVRLQGDLEWDSDDPRMKAASHLRAYSQRYKDLSKLMDIPDDRLKAAETDSADAIMFASAALRGDLEEHLIEAYVDSHQL